MIISEISLNMVMGVAQLLALSRLIQGCPQNGWKITARTWIKTCYFKVFIRMMHRFHMYKGVSKSACDIKLINNASLRLWIDLTIEFTTIQRVGETVNHKTFIGRSLREKFATCFEILATLMSYIWIKWVMGINITIELGKIVQESIEMDIFNLCLSNSIMLSILIYE